MPKERVACVERQTSETAISVRLSLDGRGAARVETGLGFFDHMLTQLAVHGFLDLELSARGDLEVDGHHLVEDVGLALGRALVEALGDKAGIKRFGFALVPMDEALAQVALDLSGRPYLGWEVKFPQEQMGVFEAALVREFFRALAAAGGVTLHARATGENSHHMAEALFKALGRALDQATQLDERLSGVPSSKGVL